MLVTTHLLQQGGHCHCALYKCAHMLAASRYAQCESRNVNTSLKSVSWVKAKNGRQRRLALCHTRWQLVDHHITSTSGRQSSLDQG
eukprot:scaffold107969_cov35-Tisochrysis_lutea.AAC.1